MNTTIASPALAPAPSFSAMNVLSWLVSKDQAYRNAQTMRDLPSHVLQDVGLTHTTNGMRRA